MPPTSSSPPATPTKTRSRSDSKGKKKMNLSEFHALLPDEEDPDDQKLPEESGVVSADQDGVKTRKWIAQWDGQNVENITDPEETTDAAQVRLSRRPSSMDELKEKFTELTNEYFDTNDMGEAVRCVSEMECPEYHYQLVKRAVLLAMEKTNKEREMIAVLLCFMHVRGVLTSEHIATGFHQLLEQADDLILDNPDLPYLLSHFVADAVLDSILPPDFITHIPPEIAEKKVAADVMKRATKRLAGKQPLGGAGVDLDEYKQQAKSLLEEYFMSNDIEEVGRRVRELHATLSYRHEIVKRAVNMGMEREEKDMEAVSLLISGLYGDVLPAPQVARGFEILLERVDDLQLDIPNAPSILARFLARAIFDECLPPSFLDVPLSQDQESQVKVLKQAHALLASPHLGVRMEKVWGPSATASVEELKAELKKILQEFLLGGDVAEAVNCLKELHSPTFHHEVVKQVVVLTMEGKEREQTLGRSLLAALVQGSQLSQEQMGLGFLRVLECLDDVLLDNPNGQQVLVAFITDAIKNGHLGPSWLTNDAPAKVADSTHGKEVLNAVTAATAA